MKDKIKRICVYCGASPGARPQYVHAAKELGRELASRGITLVYGGGATGLMGTVARAALEKGGEVIGVIPQSLMDRELGLKTVSELRVVSSMHERKAMMAELSDAFIAMPGGLGTAEEFFEAATWAQLGFHKKACALLNVDGFYDKLAVFIEHMSAEKFVDPAHAAMIIVEPTVQGVLDRIAGYRPPTVDKAKWVRMESSADLK